MSRTIVLNTLAYKEVFKEDPTVSQSELLQEIKAAGFQNVEIRREYISDGDEEIKRIAGKAKEEQILLIYSVPDELFKNNELNPAVGTYFKEAKLLTSPQVKLNLGNLSSLTKQQAEQIIGLIQKYSIKLLIENDQNKVNSNSAKLKIFFKQAEEFGLSLGLTFDIGNFVVTNEDPEESANILNPYVEYVHIKNVKKTETGNATTDIESGDLNIKAILNKFPETIPCAMEYSCGKKAGIQVKMEYERELITEMCKNFEEVTSK